MIVNFDRGLSYIVAKVTGLGFPDLRFLISVGNFLKFAYLYCPVSVMSFVVIMTTENNEYDNTENEHL